MPSSGVIDRPIASSNVTYCLNITSSVFTERFVVLPNALINSFIVFRFH